jgi:hypothetical protein
MSINKSLDIRIEQNVRTNRAATLALVTRGLPPPSPKELRRDANVTAPKRCSATDAATKTGGRGWLTGRRGNSIGEGICVQSLVEDMEISAS